MAEDIYLRDSAEGTYDLRIPAEVVDLTRQALDQGRTVVVAGRILAPLEEVHQILADATDAHPVGVHESSDTLNGSRELGRREMLITFGTNDGRATTERLHRSPEPELRDKALVVLAPDSGSELFARDVMIMRY